MIYYTRTMQELYKNYTIYESVWDLTAIYSSFPNFLFLIFKNTWFWRWYFV